jgi:hypothetical protein
MQLVAKRAGEGQLNSIAKRDPVVAAGDGFEFIHEVQVDNRRAMDANELSRIQPGFEGLQRFANEVTLLACREFFQWGHQVLEPTKVGNAVILTCLNMFPAAICFRFRRLQNGSLECLLRPIQRHKDGGSA